MKRKEVIKEEDGYEYLSIRIPVSIKRKMVEQRENGVNWSAIVRNFIKERLAGMEGRN